MFALLITLGCGPNEKAVALDARIDALEEVATTQEELRQLGALEMQLSMARTNADYNALEFRLDKVEAGLGQEAATAER